jgi:hypothetical protein
VGDGRDIGDRRPADEETTMPADSTGATPDEHGLERLVALARTDLARRLCVAIERIDVLEAEAVIWPDGGLGCPRPGMRYRQVPVDGACIRLRARGREYEYHSGGGRGPFLCEHRPAAHPGGPPDRGPVPPPTL